MSEFRTRQGHFEEHEDELSFDDDDLQLVDDTRVKGDGWHDYIDEDEDGGGNADGGGGDSVEDDGNNDENDDDNGEGIDADDDDNDVIEVRVERLGI